MLRNASYMLAAALAAAVPAGAVLAQPAPIDPGQARAYLEEAARLGAAEGGELWGVQLYGPILFVDRSSRAVVANMADAEGVLAERDGLWTGTLPEGVAVANTAARWAGREWTMLVWPLPRGRYERARLLGHEMFHRVQREVGLPMADPPNAHLDEREGRAWLRLEWRALAEALAATGDARRRAVEDASLFRAHRRALFPGAAEEENALELNEGLAEYTGLHASGLPEALARGRAVGQLESHDAAAAGGSVVRSFAYASGPAYGLLLDAADGGWRGWVAETGDVGALLARAHRVRLPLDVAAAAQARADHYDARRLFAEEAAREAERAARLAGLRARFVEGPTMTLPMAGALGLTFDPSRAEPLPGKGTVYRSAEIRDAWGTLEVSAGGVLMLRDGGMFTGVVVPAPADAARPLEGDGWRLRLAEGWTLAPGGRAGDWVVARGR